MLPSHTQCKEKQISNKEKQIFNKQKQNQLKLLDKDISVSLNKDKVTTHKNSEKPEKILEPRKSKDVTKVQKEVLKKPEKPRESRDIVRDKVQNEVIKKPEKPAIQEKKETKINEIKEEEKPFKKIHLDICSEKETSTVCTKSSGIESHTICTDSNYGKYSNNEGVTIEKSRCSCCCNAPVQQYDNTEPTNYLKSCLKMEKQCYHTNSQSINSQSINSQESARNSYYDRNWDDCNCRRKILYGGPCRSRNEFR